MAEDINKVNYNSKVSQPGLIGVYFTASWCAPCKQFSPIVEEMERKFRGKITFYKFDVSNSNKPFAKELGISRIPTVIAYKGGRRLSTYVGSSPAQFKEWLYGLQRTPAKAAQ